ncbi:hypothetical protein ABZP36_031254 [Zizania latifolia]
MNVRIFDYYQLMQVCQTVYVLRHQWAYSCDKAKRELGYKPRNFTEGHAHSSSHKDQLKVCPKFEIVAKVTSKNEAIAEAVTNINSSSLKYEENSSTEAASLQMQEIEKLKVTMDSFNLVMREEETLSRVELDAMKGYMDLLFHELDSPRGKVEKQDSYISEKSREFDVIVSRLKQALRLIHHNEIALSELYDRLRTVLDSQKELEKQNRVLSAIIEEKEEASSSSISREKEFMECMRYVESMRDFKKFVIDQQTTIANKIQHGESRCLHFH